MPLPVAMTRRAREDAKAELDDENDDCGLELVSGCQLDTIRHTFGVEAC